VLFECDVLPHRLLAKVAHWTKGITYYFELIYRDSSWDPEQNHETPFSK